MSGTFAHAIWPYIPNSRLAPIASLRRKACPGCLGELSCRYQREGHCGEVGWDLGRAAASDSVNTNSALPKRRSITLGMPGPSAVESSDGLFVAPRAPSYSPDMEMTPECEYTLFPWCPICACRFAPQLALQHVSCTAHQTLWRAIPHQLRTDSLESIHLFFADYVIPSHIHQLWPAH